jgi:hypothetical protein
MYRQARERIIATEIRKLERRQAVERSMRAAQRPCGGGRLDAGEFSAPAPRDGIRAH